MCIDIIFHAAQWCIAVPPRILITEIETKILNTDSDPKNTDRDSDRYTANYSDLSAIDEKGKSRMQTCRTLQK